MIWVRACSMVGKLPSLPPHSKGFKRCKAETNALLLVLESVPSVDRAFVHLDYKRWNLPSHLSQQAD